MTVGPDRLLHDSPPTADLSDVSYVGRPIEHDQADADDPAAAGHGAGSGRLPGHMTRNNAPSSPTSAWPSWATIGDNTAGRYRVTECRERVGDGPGQPARTHAREIETGGVFGRTNPTRCRPARAKSHAASQAENSDPPGRLAPPSVAIVVRALDRLMFGPCLARFAHPRAVPPTALWRTGTMLRLPMCTGLGNPADLAPATVYLGLPRSRGFRLAGHRPARAQPSRYAGRRAPRTAGRALGPTFARREGLIGRYAAHIGPHSVYCSPQSRGRGSVGGRVRASHGAGSRAVRLLILRLAVPAILPELVLSQVRRAV
jgi:hypothetical protein